MSVSRFSWLLSDLALWPSHATTISRGYSVATESVLPVNMDLKACSV